LCHLQEWHQWPRLVLHHRHWLQVAGARGVGVGQCRVLLGGWRLGGWSSRDRLWLKPQSSHRPNEAESVLSLNKSKRTGYAVRKRICTYSKDFFMADFFSLRARGFLTTVFVAGGGVTQSDCEVPTTAMVINSTEVVNGSVPAVSATPPTGTSSPANSVPVTFWRFGLGGEAEGLQNRQCQHATTLLFDNSIGQQLHTWGVRLHALYVCALPDDPEGPMAKLRPTPRMVRGSCSFSPSLQFPFPPGGFRSQSFHRWVKLWLLELFSLQLQRWEEGGPVGGYRVVVDNSGTTLCVPVEDFQSTVVEQQNLFQSTRILIGFGGLCAENNSGT
jgi:hypothetical protein